MAINRRAFLASSAIASTAAFVGQAPLEAANRKAPVARVRWLDDAPPALDEGLTWGLPWPRGTVAREAVLSADDAGLPIQTWTTATWPDGSVKWTAHAIPANSFRKDAMQVGKGKTVSPKSPVRVREGSEEVVIECGAVTWTITRSGDGLINSATRGGREVLSAVNLVAISQDVASLDEAESVTRRSYAGRTSKITVEQSGPVRAVVRVEGEHRNATRGWLPFSVRLYFHAGSDAVRVVHSFVFDGDADKDFISGLGLSGKVAMSDAPYDRHVRFSGEDDGIWGEAVQTVTGLRRDPGEKFRKAQVAGKALPPLSGMAEAVRKGLPRVPQWGDFTLSQPNADGFTLTKRTGPGHGWIDVDGGSRATGLGFVGGVSGGVAFGLQDFWQRYPVRLDIRNAQTDLAEFTMWHHSPSALAMDMRFYHDGMGMNDHFEENEGLDITYEDYEKGWGTPYGIGRTTEFVIWALPSTPSRERLADMARFIARPPRLVATPETIHAASVFGDWSLPDRSSPKRDAIEDQNAFLLDFYRGQIEQRRWYGFWNYGDVMHTYDADRHVWRYDVGGFAWDNSELSTDLWLWYSFLRTGDAAVFRMAEAMTRHTGEVDVYHIGKWKGLGTRHGVQHWSDSSKQPRISNAAYRRIFFYLTADERCGDLMREVLAGDAALRLVDIGRKVNARPDASAYDGTGAQVAGRELGTDEIFMQFGTSWCSLLSAWLTEWERTGDTRWRDHIVSGMKTIAAMPRQWFAGGSSFDLTTGRFTGPGDTAIVSHLNAVFGAVEVNSELLSLLDVPAYRDAWIDYCVAYNAPKDVFARMAGTSDGGRNLMEGHSRLTAYAANKLQNRDLAARAWKEFFSGRAGLGMNAEQSLTLVKGADALRPAQEAPDVSTNTAAQWGLAAIQNLALIGDYLE